MLVKIIVVVIFWIMTLMLGFYMEKEGGRKEGK